MEHASRFSLGETPLSFSKKKENKSTITETPLAAEVPIDLSFFDITFDPFAPPETSHSSLLSLEQTETETLPLSLAVVTKDTQSVVRPVPLGTVQKASVAMEVFAQATLTMPGLFGHLGSFCAHCIASSTQLMNVAQSSFATTAQSGHWHSLAGGGKIWHAESHDSQDHPPSTLDDDSPVPSATKPSTSWGKGPLWIPSFAPESSLSQLEELWLPQLRHTAVCEVPALFLQ